MRRTLPAAGVDHPQRPAITTTTRSVGDLLHDDDDDSDHEENAAIETDQDHNHNNDETTSFLLRKTTSFTLPLPSNGSSRSSLEVETTTTLNHDRRQQQQQQQSGGTASHWAVTMNLAKCICGAGSFALPHVFRHQGILGGLISMTVCGILSTATMEWLMQARLRCGILPSSSGCASTTTAASAEDLSYVQLARAVLGHRVAQVVFVLTLAASWGVCSTYVVFIGQTMESLTRASSSSSSTVPEDEVTLSTNNFVQQVFPNVSCTTWEVAITFFVLYPLSCISDYSIFAFTSTLGVLSVLGGILVTLIHGLWVDPGWDRAMYGLQNLRWWPKSGVALGSSLGTMAYLFGIHFLTFPIMNSMREPDHYGRAVRHAVGGVWLVNVIFAVLCVGFYGDNTQDLVLANLNNGPYLAALKLFLCIDLLFTFPIVFSSGRQIMEQAWLTFRGNTAAGKHDDDDDNDYNCPNALKVSMTERAVLVAVAVTLCLGLSQIGSFGTVANLVGGVAQGTLAFVLPPAIVLQLARTRRLVLQPHQILAQWLVGALGVITVTSVTYTTVSVML